MIHSWCVTTVCEGGQTKFGGDAHSIAMRCNQSSARRARVTPRVERVGVSTCGERVRTESHAWEFECRFEFLLIIENEINPTGLSGQEWSDTSIQNKGLMYAGELARLNVGWGAWFLWVAERGVTVTLYTG